MTPAQSEGDWLIALEPSRRQIFLAALSHQLTVAGRSAYQAGTEDLERPIHLRRINEAQHRVTACLHQLLRGSASTEFQRSIPSWLLEQEDAELRDVMAWAWHAAKQAAER